MCYTTIKVYGRIIREYEVPTFSILIVVDILRRIIFNDIFVKCSRSIINSYRFIIIPINREIKLPNEQNKTYSFIFRFISVLKKIL